MNIDEKWIDPAEKLAELQEGEEPYEDERWAWLDGQPLQLDLDFDAAEPAVRQRPGVPEHYRAYQFWWSRPWPVCREDHLLEPDIPTLPDISAYKRTA